jgi:hypothetical protein
MFVHNHAIRRAVSASVRSEYARQVSAPATMKKVRRLLMLAAVIAMAASTALAVPRVEARTTADLRHTRPVDAVGLGNSQNPLTRGLPP